MNNKSVGTIITFYSYKGGVGRSMALANTAAMLAKWNKRVLIVDWDFEAPGIELYFRKWLADDQPRSGLLDLLCDWSEGTEIEYQDAIVTPECDFSGQIDILGSGNKSDNYSKRLRSLDWPNLFSKQRLGDALEKLRENWKSRYDFVLIDSRTGITDIGGICTIMMPDILLMVFTANDQNIDGTQAIGRKVLQQHAELAVDRRKLIIVPILSRDETENEYELAQKWREKAAKKLSEFIEDWIPPDETPSSILNYMRLPYHPYWSFGERLPVLEEKDADNPKTLAYSFKPIASLLRHNMDWSAVRSGENVSIEETYARAKLVRERQGAAKQAESIRQKQMQDLENLKWRINEARDEAFTVQAKWEKRKNFSATTSLTLGVLGVLAGAVTSFTIALPSTSQSIKSYWGNIFGLEVIPDITFAFLSALGISILVSSILYSWWNYRKRFRLARDIQFISTRETEEFYKNIPKDSTLEALSQMEYLLRYKIDFIDQLGKRNYFCY